MAEGQVMLGGFSRVFSIDGQAGPDNTPFYHSWAAAGGIDQPVGDITRVEAPSETEYGAFDDIGEYLGAVENASITLTLQDRMSASEVLDYARRRCAFDIQIHQGTCKDPRDFDSGWDKIRVFEGAHASSYSTSDLGSLESGDVDKVTEELEISAKTYYEILPMTYSEKASSEVTNEVIAIVVCDLPSCGDCDDPSDGCQKVFAVSAPAGTSPGLAAEVIYSEDGFATASDTPITTLAAGQDPDDAECVGNNLVVVSNAVTDFGLHYAATADILAGTETWTKITNGLVATNYPTCISSASPRHTWIGADNGYVYFTADPTNSVSIQESGSLTTEDLRDIYAYSTKLVVAVCSAGVVLYTNNGEDWALATSPAAGVDLNCVFIRKPKEWWVGDDNGQLWYTRDAGVTWTEKEFSGSGSGSVNAIKFVSDSVGFMAHNESTIIHPNLGRILRTISGGNTWYVAPEGSASLTAVDQINDLATCIKRENVIYAGGLADNGADGVVLKGTN